MKTFGIIVVGFSLIFASCNDFDEPVFVENQSIDVVIDDEAINETSPFGKEDEIEFLDCNGNVILFGDLQQKSISEMMGSPFSTYSSDNVKTIIGYTSKIYMNSKAVFFPEQPLDKRLHRGVYYTENYYTYICEIKVDKGSTITIPTSFDDSWPMGMKPSNQSEYGYEIFGPVSADANYETYQLRTIIGEITHNLAGQELGFTSYLPFRVGNPSTDLIFKYVAIKIEW